MNQVIFKVDDFLSDEFKLGNDIIANWRRFLYLIDRYNAKVSLGVIGKSLSSVSIKDELVDLILRQGDSVEIFNHGYNHELLNVDIGLNQRVLQTIFSSTHRTYGAPFNAINDSIIKELESLPEIKYVYMMTINDKIMDVMRVKKVIPINGYRELENWLPGISFVQWDNFITKYSPQQKGFKVYQMHPLAWGDQDFDVFEEILKKFVADGKQWIFPSEL